jgi:H+/Cl- antiporter ClcA
MVGLCRSLLPRLDVQPEAFAVVGMAAFFTGVVRAPITGIVLTTEMTASVTMLCPVHARATKTLHHFEIAPRASTKVIGH